MRRWERWIKGSRRDCRAEGHGLLRRLDVESELSAGELRQRDQEKAVRGR